MYLVALGVEREGEGSSWLGPLSRLSLGQGSLGDAAAALPGSTNRAARPRSGLSKSHTEGRKELS